MHDGLTPAEVAVLTALADTAAHRWWDLESLLLETGLEERAVLYALHELDRRDLATRMFSAKIRSWTITTLGESALARAGATA